MKTKHPSILLLVLVTLALPLYGQEPEARTTWSIGLRAGYAPSTGEWNNVRLAPEVKLLTTSFTFDADIAMPLSERLSLVLDAGYQPLDGGEWEAYAAERGDITRVTGSFVSAGLLLRPYLRSEKPNLFWIEFGPAVLFASAEERFNGTVYSYDFFNSIKFGGKAAIGYERMIGEYTAITFKAGAIVFPTGFSYADGQKFTMTVLPITTGLLMFF